MGHQGKLERHAESLARDSTEGVAVSDVRIFTLGIRHESAFVTATESTQAVSIRGNSLFSDMRKEVMND